tara:strand:- start:13 stop:519 length:507 start_codon:yes stop_codon:yes gene_type:complete
MFAPVNFKNGRVNIIDQPNPNALFNLYDKTKTYKSSFRDALKGTKEENELSNAFFSKQNIQIVQNGLRAGVYKMSNNQYIIGEQSYDNIKIIMQDAYFEHAKNDLTSIAKQIETINQEIFNKYVPKLHGEVIGYLKYKEDTSNIKAPINYAKPSGDKNFKNLEFKNRW